MQYEEFYSQMFQPLEARFGVVDAETIVPIVGFDAGGPLSFCTFGNQKHSRVRTFVTCELACRAEQKPTSTGRYELLVSCDDENWVRSIVSDIGRMSLEVKFDSGHTLDISPWVGDTANIQGVMFEKLCVTAIEGKFYCILLVIGVTRPELMFAQRFGVPALIERLKGSGIYPSTVLDRESISGIDG